MFKLQNITELYVLFVENKVNFPERALLTIFRFKKNPTTV